MPMPATKAADVHHLLAPETIRLGLPGTDKNAVIRSLVDVLRGHEAVTDVEAVREAVFQREAKMSTGVGKSLALPHAKTPAADATLAAFATTAEPVDFGAIDGEPVRLVFLLVGPEHAKSRHIKILGRISRLVSRDEVRHALADAATPDEVIRIFREGEARLRR
jgi:PTS system fructose-specific IIA component